MTCVGDQLPRGADPARPVPRCPSCHGFPARSPARRQTAAGCSASPRQQAAATPNTSALDESGSSTCRDGASFEEGAAFLMAYLTAWIPLTRQVISDSGPVFSSMRRQEASESAASQSWLEDLGARGCRNRPSSRGQAGAPRSSLGASEAFTYDRPSARSRPVRRRLRPRRRGSCSPMLRSAS